MREYELTIVLPGDSTTAKKKSVTGKVERVISTLKGKIKSKEDWGNIELANSIKGSSNGIFIHFILELESSGAKGVEDKVKMEDDIIRYLFLRKEND